METQKVVLVVESEAYVVHVLEVKLRNNGFGFYGASNGGEGYRMACQEKPDIVVIDSSMIEMVEKMRENEGTKNVPVILLNSRSYCLSQEQQELLGIDKVLSKPFSPAALIVAIKEILSV